MGNRTVLCLWFPVSTIFTKLEPRRPVQAEPAVGIFSVNPQRRSRRATLFPPSADHLEASSAPQEETNRQRDLLYWICVSVPHVNYWALTHMPNLLLVSALP